MNDIMNTFVCKYEIYMSNEKDNGAFWLKSK